MGTSYQLLPNPGGLVTPMISAQMSPFQMVQSAQPCTQQALMVHPTNPSQMAMVASPQNGPPVQGSLQANQPGGTITLPSQPPPPVQGGSPRSSANMAIDENSNAKALVEIIKVRKRFVEPAPESHHEEKYRNLEACNSQLHQYYQHEIHAIKIHAEHWGSELKDKFRLSEVAFRDAVQHQTDQALAEQQMGLINDFQSSLALYDRGHAEKLQWVESHASSKYQEDKTLLQAEAVEWATRMEQEMNAESQEASSSHQIPEEITLLERFAQDARTALREAQQKLDAEAAMFREREGHLIGQLNVEKNEAARLRSSGGYQANQYEQLLVQYNTLQQQSTMSYQSLNVAYQNSENERLKWRTECERLASLPNNQNQERVAEELVAEVEMVQELNEQMEYMQERMQNREAETLELEIEEETFSDTLPVPIHSALNVVPQLQLPTIMEARPLAPERVPTGPPGAYVPPTTSAPAAETSNPTPSGTTHPTTGSAYPKASAPPPAAATWYWPGWQVPTPVVGYQPSASHVSTAASPRGATNQTVTENVQKQKEADSVPAEHLPEVQDFHKWKIQFELNVAACHPNIQETLAWIRKVDAVNSIEELNTLM